MLKIIYVSVSSRSYILSYPSFPASVADNIAYSFRLLSELYSLLFIMKNSIKVVEDWVSVSSRSYILSYVPLTLPSVSNNPLSFRLLSELYSLLCYIYNLCCFPISVSVSSRSYILSYLIDNFNINIVMIKVSVSSRSYILSYPTLKKSFVCNSL